MRSEAPQNHPILSATFPFRRGGRFCAQGGSRISDWQRGMSVEEQDTKIEHLNGWVGKWSA